MHIEDYLYQKDLYLPLGRKAQKSSLPETWDDFVMVVSNSSRTGTLKFDNTVGVLLSKEAHKKSSGTAETLGSALSVERKEVDE